MRSTFRLGLASCWLVVGAQSLGCSSDLPTTATLVQVETNLPIGLANRLRVDLFHEDGQWYASRDFALPNASDWPTGFGVSADDLADHTVYARLRAYPEGLLRDYQGERFASNDPVTDLPTATNLKDMCARATELPMGKRVVVRRAPTADPFVDFGSCGQDNGGSAAAYIDIPQAGDYTIGALGTLPLESPFTGTSAFYKAILLQLRTSCADGKSVFSCINSATNAAALPTLTGPLPAGRVYVFVGSDATFAPTDIELGVTPAGQWPPPKAPETQGVDIPLTTGPAPSQEPVPGVTVDRLVALHLVGGVRSTHHVTLDGACVGHMSFLGATGFSPSEARSCVDAATTFAPVHDAHDAPIKAPFFPAKPCGADPPAGSVCVEGGAGILGTRVPSDGPPVASTPERTYAVSPFFLDRTEVTVARFRAVFPSLGGYAEPVIDTGCTYKKTGNDDLPVTCLSWYLARAFCTSQGGDLPTEAQWEHAATQSGRANKTRYPWGDDAAQCSCSGQDVCHAPVAGGAVQGGRVACNNKQEKAVLASVGDNGDETVDGVVGLAGNVSEMIKDTLAPYDGPCWRAAPVLDPVCFEEHSPLRAMRGGDFLAPLFTIGGAFRSETSTFPGTSIGFRCAYPVSP